MRHDSNELLASSEALLSAWADWLNAPAGLDEDQWAGVELCIGALAWAVEAESPDAD